jgi:hypothetical protein
MPVRSYGPLSSFKGLSLPETTKPSHFCEGFVLYGAAPGVESEKIYRKNHEVKKY